MEMFLIGIFVGTAIGMSIVILMETAVDKKFDAIEMEEKDSE